MPSTGIGPKEGWTSLHDAAKSDDLEALINSVEAKKGMPIRDVDMPSATGLTPLHVAAMHGSDLCIPYLVSMNSDLTIVDSFGRIAVHYAAESGHLTSCMQLIASGQDMNAQDNDGNTPLHLAARGSSKACEYLIEIGANLSMRNNRGWTPLQSASVPMYRMSQEILEESIPILQKIRREADPTEVRAFLEDCGMQSFEPLFLKAGYGGQHLFVSCRPVSLTVLNNCAEQKTEMMSLREYLYFLENLSRYHGLEKRNPFSENAQKQRYWDEHPEKFEAMLKENPDYDAAAVDDSEWRRTVLPKEREYMDFLQQVVAELRVEDKTGAFSSMMTRTGIPVTGADGRVNLDSELMYKGIENVVDNGWPGVPALDFEQIEKNINDGMYGIWDQMALDFVLMICNAFVYFRAVKSDMETGFKAGIPVLARGLRIIRKHRTALIKLQAAAFQEKRQQKAKTRYNWVRWATDKRLRGLLPDKWLDAINQAEEDEDKSLQKAYLERFETIEAADDFWGGGGGVHPSKNMMEASRIGWEGDTCCIRTYKWIKWALDVASSRDAGMHLQHPQTDPRSDMHMPLSDFKLAKTREGESGTEEENLRKAFIREVVWAEDFDSMRARLTHDPKYDMWRKYPDDYTSVDQVLLGFLVILSNVIVFHDKHHLHMKTVLDKKQLPLFLVPKSPIKIRVEPGGMGPFQARILWDQLPPKPGEVVTGYEIELITRPEQTVDPLRTLSKPGKIEYIQITIGGSEANSRPPSARPKSASGSPGGGAYLISTGKLKVPDADMEAQVDTSARHSFSATRQGGWCQVQGLSPCTDYLVYMRAISEGDVYGPVSGPVLIFQTAPHCPEMVPHLEPRHVASDCVVLAWDAPRDNGSGVMDYEVEYTDTSFGTVYKAKVGYNARNFSTALIQMPPGSDDPLKPGYALAPQESILLPATTILCRVRALNPAGWGPWVDPLLNVTTTQDRASAPQSVAITGTGPDHIQICWMPPVRCNSIQGIQGYRVYVTVTDGEHAGLSREMDLTLEDLRKGSIEEGLGTASSRPSTSSSRSGVMRRRHRADSARISHGASSRSGSRASSASRRRADQESGVVAVDDDQINDDEDAEDEVELDEIDIQSTRPKTPPKRWWETTPFVGKVWFATEVPAKVYEKALLDFPTIGADNNLIVLQTRGHQDWEQERYAVIPAMAYRAEQLANRLQRCLQDLLPIELGLRFNVTNTADNVFRIVLNRQFRLKMPPSLAYVLGLIRSSGGWIVSPAIKNVGLADDKSVLLASYPHKLTPKICDLVPIRLPNMLEVDDLPPGSNISIRISAKNGAGKTYGDLDSLGKISEAVSGRTEPVAPPPPREVTATGVLSTAINVNWKAPLSKNGSIIARYIVEYVIEGQGLLTRSLDPLMEGFQISNLRPGQKVHNIRLRSQSDMGLFGMSSEDETASRAPTRPSTNPSSRPGTQGPDAASETSPNPAVGRRGNARAMRDGVWARALCEVPTPPFNLEPIASNSSSITFGWEVPLFDGGSPVLEWELRGHRQDGTVFEHYFPHPCGNKHTISDLPERPSVGEMLLAVTVRARNAVGWSKPSNSADGKCTDGPPPHPDRMNKYMRDKGARQDLSVAELGAAIESGLEAERAAEKAALQPMRLKKAMMEEAENLVLIAEKALVAAIAESDASGVSAIGVSKPTEDVEARMLLERLRLKRLRRWGSSRRGMQI